MDPLALLCNLHGDGPATLHRLRRSGCDTLAGLGGRPPSELAPVLGWEEARAQRFLREADHLSQRLGENLLDDDEPAPEPPEEAPVLADEDLDEGETAYDFEVELELDEEEEEEEEEERERAGDFVGAWEESFADDLSEELVDELEEELESELHEEELAGGEVKERVLDRWRELDESNAPLEVPQSVGSPPDAAAGRADVLVPHTPDVPLRPPGTPLGEAEIDGLDPARVRALVAAGVTTLEELSEAEDFELHQRSGLPYTLTCRLGFLARRALKTRLAAPRTAAAPPADERRLDAAGPFA